jgi:hypothetical protein
MPNEVKDLLDLLNAVTPDPLTGLTTIIMHFSTLDRLRALVNHAEDYARLIKAARDVEESGINFTYPRFYEIQVDKSVWNELKSALARVEEET